MTAESTSTAALEEVRVFTAATGVVDTTDGRSVHPDPWWAVDGSGRVVDTGHGERPARWDGALVRDLGRSLVVPGMINAHSHAFQRAIRGRTHRRGAHDPSSFWSWRTQMYTAANALTPARIYEDTRACYREMLAAGITCVGEFHYVHHQPDGRPYDDPNELSMQVIAAARDVGIKLVLLEVLYLASGIGEPPLPEQRRFCDGDVDAYLARCDALRPHLGGGVRLGLAPHSVRAVPARALAAVADYAAHHDLVVHAHVSEQVAENEACRAALGRSPVAVFHEAGLCDRPRTFTAVHAIHVDDADRTMLASQHVCACPTTEADLGDGTILAGALRRAGVTVALGSDSNSIIDLVTEARSLELHERLATQRRLCVAHGDERPAGVLLDAATVGGGSALGDAALGRLGVGDSFDAVVFDRGHRALADVDDAHLLDALMLAGSAAPVREVFIDGSERL